MSATVWEIVEAVLIVTLAWLVGFLQGGTAARGNLKARLYKLMEREDARAPEKWTRDWHRQQRTSDRELPRDRW